MLLGIGISCTVLNIKRGKAIPVSIDRRLVSINWQSSFVGIFSGILMGTLVLTGCAYF